MNYIKYIVALIIVCIAFSAHAQPMNPQVLMQTSMGDITIELDAKAAPKTVANFLDYVRSGFYSDTIFHRVIKGFMIQGGGLTADMTKKEPRTPIQNEADNKLQNLTGTIAMARTNDPHSATSQFFINVKDNHPLNHRAKKGRHWGYCVFGRVIKGLEVVKAIEVVPTTMKAGRRDVPAKVVIIKKVSIIEPKKPTSKQ